jgi:hypothetical protein
MPIYRGEDEEIQRAEHVTNHDQCVKFQLCCRVAIKVGKECAIKIGMELEDRDVEENYGFGVWIWGMAEVINVTIRTEAADDSGAG